MKCYVMQFSAASSYFLLPKVKYFPRYSVIRCLQPVLFFQSDRPEFRICINSIQNYYSFYLNVYILREQRKKNNF